MTTPRKGPAFEDRVTAAGIERHCRRCRQWHLLTEFVRHAQAKHGRLYTCRICHNGVRSVMRKAEPGEWVRIGDLARQLNEPEHTIRFWEDEFAPQTQGVRRSKGDQRVYPPQAAELFVEIQRLLRVELYTIAGAKRQLRLAAERERQAG